MCGYIFNKNDQIPIISDDGYMKQLHEERMLKFLQIEVQENDLWKSNNIKDEGVLEELFENAWNFLLDDIVSFFN